MIEKSTSGSAVREPIHVAIITTDALDGRRILPKTSPTFGTAPAANLEGFAERGDIRVSVISCVRHPAAVAEDLASNIRYIPVRVSRLGFMRSLYAESIWRVRKILRDLNPDVVHGHGTENFCALCAAFSGFPNLVTIHGNMRAIATKLGARPLSFYWGAARLEGIALRKTGGVVCNSAYTESEVVRDARKAWRIPNALAEDFFTSPAKSENAVPVLVNVGTILAAKQPLELLELLKKLRAEGSRFEIEFIGGGNSGTPYGKRFFDALADIADEGWARYLGVLERDKLIEHLDRADALVHVSVEESFGLAVAEGLARNLRLFAFRAGGLADITSGIPDAAVFDVNDWAGLGSSLERWFADGAPDGRPAAGIMRERYHPEVVADQHLEIYQELGS